MKENVRVELPGTIASMVRNAFVVRLDHNGHMLRARISGRMEQRHTRLAVGDRVTVEMTPYDPSKGRIVWRSK
jgi:translation initiation factor IF-1